MNIRLTADIAKMIDNARLVTGETERAFIRRACVEAARRALVSHASDCATHNAPALPVGECDCQ